MCLGLSAIKLELLLFCVFHKYFCPAYRFCWIFHGIQNNYLLNKTIKFTWQSFSSRNTVDPRSLPNGRVKMVKPQSNPSHTHSKNASKMPQRSQKTRARKWTSKRILKPKYSTFEKTSGNKKNLQALFVQFKCRLCKYQVFFACKSDQLVHAPLEMYLLASVRHYHRKEPCRKRKNI